MSDLDYVYAVARIRVKEKMLLSDADVSQMAGMKDEEEVMGFFHRKDGEILLKKKTLKNFWKKKKTRPGL